ncbi:MAG: hypothetical protein AAF471_02790 [Myxococcota bacterium]
MFVSVRFICLAASLASAVAFAETPKQSTEPVPAASRKTSTVRFIMTNGLGQLNSERAFYRTLLRQGDVVHPDQGPFTLEKPGLSVLRSQDTLFVTQSRISKEAILAAKGKTPDTQGTLRTIAGPHVLGFGLPVMEKKNATPMIPNFTDPFLTRELSGTLQQHALAIYTIEGQQLLAVDLTGKTNTVRWPDGKDELFYTTGAVGGYAQSSERFLFVARQSASLARALGIVDRLRKDKSLPTAYLDLGNALPPEDPDAAVAVQSMLLQRSPIALTARRGELESFAVQPNLLAKKAYLVPARGEELQTGKVVQVGSQRLQLSLVGDGTQEGGAFLPKGATPVNRQQSMTQASQLEQARQIPFAMALALDAASAQQAAASPLFDVVVAPADRALGSLPPRADISLNAQNAAMGRALGARIDISPEDVTELRVELDRKGNPTRIHVIRHALAAERTLAPDAQLFEVSGRQALQQSPGLPARGELGDGKNVWTADELDQILGSLLLQQVPKARSALIGQAREPLTTVTGALPQEALTALWQSVNGRVVLVKLSGHALKQVFTLAKKGEFPVPFTLVGGELKGPTIQKRGVHAEEMYRVVMTERVFTAITTFLKKQGMLSSNSIQADQLDTYISKKSKLKVWGKARTRGVDKFDPDHITQAITNSPRVEGLVEAAFAEGRELSTDACGKFLRQANGKARHAFILDIKEIDLGGHIQSSVARAETWRDDKDNQFNVNGDLLEDFSLHVLANTGLELAYEGPAVDTGVTGTFQFFHTDRNGKPIDDKIKAEYELRVPMERLLEKPDKWTFSPLAKASYETKLFQYAPVIEALTEQTADSDDGKKWLGDRKNKLEFFLGTSVRPPAHTGHANVFRAGPIARLNLEELEDPNQALNAGLQVAYEDKWSWKPVTFKLTTELNGFIPFADVASLQRDKEALELKLNGKLLFGIVGHLSIAILGESLTANTMKDLGTFGSALKGGLALSYDQRFKWDW